jgi:hypothetical protein
METYDKNLISLVKKNLKKIGELSLPLCRNDKDSEAEDVARNINKLAHETFELIWLAENQNLEAVTMQALKEEGVKPWACQHRC